MFYSAFSIFIISPHVKQECFKKLNFFIVNNTDAVIIFLIRLSEVYHLLCRLTAMYAHV